MTEKQAKVKFVVCISGERNVESFKSTISVVLDELKKSVGEKLHIIFGDCTGVYTTAKELCIEMKINYKDYPANWTKHGKNAGPIRNKEMVDLADVVYAFHTDIRKSKGTKNTIKLAKAKGIPIHLFDR
jgi:hypothetical protein